MGHLGLVLALLAVGAGRVTVAKFSIQEAQVRILDPPSTSAMTMAMADFGKPRYGATLRGELVDPDLLNSKCSLADCRYGCAPFSSAAPPISLKKEAGKNYIMLLERGPSGGTQQACYFVDKAYHAQLAGADAVLVVNNVDGELSTLIAPEDDDTVKELADMHIPAAMIYKADGARLRELLQAGSVTLQLSWAKSVPDAQVVDWEFWTSSEDGCGYSCNGINDFTKAMKEQAQALEKANRTIFTPRYFLYDCAGSLSSPLCRADCFYKGDNSTFCGNSPNENYNGTRVVEMNVRAACFHKLAASAGVGWLWWDYATLINTDCSVALNKYDKDCAKQIFIALNGTSLPGGLDAWEECSRVEDGHIPEILEETLASMKGNATSNISAVGMLPTIRINGAQFRGSLEASEVLRAICTGFIDGQEPPVCKDVSEDECQPGGDGWKACGLGDPTLGSRVRCVDTFEGYMCICNSGMKMITDPVSGDQRCDDVNECLATTEPYNNADCRCDRCACVNKVGSYKCTGPLPDRCNKDYNFGNCWHETINGTEYHACVDTFWTFKEQAEKGLVTENDAYLRCQCPKCFEDTEHGCKPKCDLRFCDSYTGICMPDGDKKTAGGGSGSGGGGGGAAKSSGGAGFGFLVLVALGSALLTGVVVMAAQRYMMRQRMGDEIRDIMAQYMPLEERERKAMLAANQRSRGPGGQIRPDEDSDDDAHVGAFGWPAARPAPPPSTLGPLSTGPKLNVPAAAGGPAHRGTVTWGPPPRRRGPRWTCSRSPAPRTPICRRRPPPPRPAPGRCRPPPSQLPPVAAPPAIPTRCWDWSWAAAPTWMTKRLRPPAGRAPAAAAASPLTTPSCEMGGCVPQRGHSCGGGGEVGPRRLGLRRPAAGGMTAPNSWPFLCLQKGGRGMKRGSLFMRRVDGWDLQSLCDVRRGRPSSLPMHGAGAGSFKLRTFCYICRSALVMAAIRGRPGPAEQGTPSGAGWGRRIT